MRFTIRVEPGRNDMARRLMLTIFKDRSPWSKRLSVAMVLSIIIFSCSGQASGNIPATIAEAHIELEKWLPPDELAKIDAMESEEGMNAYHFGLGMSIRNGWLRPDHAPLADHMRTLGFHHFDDMSAVILDTFWCKRHGRPFRLPERAGHYARYWESVAREQRAEEERVKLATLAMQQMMMGLRFEQKRVPVVRMQDRTYRDLSARFLAPFRGGVISVLKPWHEPSEGVTTGYFLDLSRNTVHEIGVHEVDDVRSAIAVGGVAWFAGLANGQPVLVGIAEDTRRLVPLPLGGEPPQLGRDGQNLLAVYPRAVYRLSDQSWTLAVSSDMPLPRAGPPPEIHGGVLYLRDESELYKRLWWLELKEGARLTSIDKDIKLVGSHGPRWETSFSYCITGTGELWASVGGSSSRKSLLRRSRDGSYSIGILHNSVNFSSDLFGSEMIDQGLSVSAVAELREGPLLLVGDRGLYRLSGNQLTQELAFENTRQKIPVEDGHNYHFNWTPNNILSIDDHTYLISGTYGGIYLLSKSREGKWVFQSLDETRGEPIAW